MTVIGIDAHKRTHTLVAIDSGGRKLAQKTISATGAVHAQGHPVGDHPVRHRPHLGLEDNR